MIIIAIIAVLICICSSISGGVAFYFMQKESTEKPKVPPPAGKSPPPPTASPPPPAASGRKYTKSVNMDSGGSDIACFQDGSSADFCKTKCDNDTTCKGYNYISVDPNRGWGWAGKSGCCYKTINGPLVSAPGIDFYALDSPACNLDCNAVQSKAKTHYDTIGEWKNVFTMTPNKVNKVNDTQCDILYTYNPTPGGGRSDVGEDKRRFTFSKDANCNWNVTAMDGYQSGITF
jgi:hypothetical protein